MAATMAQGQCGTPLKEPTQAAPAETNDLWDQIESKHWEQIYALRREEDRQLEGNYRSIADKLQADKVRRHEESVAIVKQIKELQDRLNQLKHEDVVADTDMRELDKSFEAKRLALQASREKEEREKRELFKMHRRAAQNGAATRRTGSTTPAPTTATTHTTHTTLTTNSIPNNSTERPGPLADRSVQSDNIPARTPVEAAEKQQVQVKEVKVIQVVETQIKTVAREEIADQAAQTQQVQEAAIQMGEQQLVNGNEAMDIDKNETSTAEDHAENATENRADAEPIVDIPNGTDGQDGLANSNGTDLHAPPVVQNGGPVQSAGPAQNGIPVQNGAPGDHIHAQVETALQNGTLAQSEKPNDKPNDKDVQESIEADQDGQDGTAVHTETIAQKDTTVEDAKADQNDTTAKDHQAKRNDTATKDGQDVQKDMPAQAEKNGQNHADVQDDKEEEAQNVKVGEKDEEAAPNGPNAEGEKTVSSKTDVQTEEQVDVQKTTEEMPRTTREPQQDAEDSMDIDEGIDVIGGPPQRPRLDTESSSELTSAHSTPVASPPGYQTQVEDTSKPVTPVEQHFKGVEVYDGSGELVGTVRHINLENRWVEHVKTLPIKRPVEIRPGRKFTAENLESIYEPSDAKGAKWLSCYIQATGEVQGQPCHTCTKPVGVFSQCVILGVEGFPRCGNCEWNRQGCNGASLLPRSRQSLGEESPSKAKAKPPPVSTGGFTPVNNSASGQHARSPTEDAKPAKSAKGTPAQQTNKAGRKSLPNSSTQRSKAQAETPLATTPTTGSPAPEGGEGAEDLEEINKSVIVFEDDGRVFTKPDFMAGVPLEKISESHSYWDPNWAPLEPLISATLTKWEEKLEHHIQAASAAASKFLANRQVNRGKAILEFLRDGELHPYQIVGKKYITKGLAGYDTLFRLVQVLGELRKFQIDITPSQWLRHRLYEVWQEQGHDFNLAKTVHNLYHDPKVSAIRAKSGFGNIGRPSGYRMDKDEQPKRASRNAKRKEPHATPKSAAQQQRRKSVSVPKTEEAEEKEQHEQTAAAVAAAAAALAPNYGTRPRSSHRKSRGVSAEQQLQQHLHKEDAKAGHGSPREAKKQRLRTTDVEAEDLMYEGYTSSDSFSKDHVMPVDWRVHQVKHAKISTNTCVTQYWHFVDPADGGEDDYLFEHQVLKDVLPNRVAWGVYKEPYDFHLRLHEITEATFARDCDHVIIGTREIPGVVYRGDLMVAFKRARTRKRFLAFLRKKGIRLIRTSKDYVEKAWIDMDSEVLPHYDSDG